MVENPNNLIQVAATEIKGVGPNFLHKVSRIKRVGPKFLNKVSRIIYFFLHGINHFKNHLSDIIISKMCASLFLFKLVCTFNKIAIS